MGAGEVWALGAVELAALVAAGEVSAAEVVAAQLERIAVVNPQVNAVTRLMGDSARQAAQEVDRRRAAGERLGPLAGVPFTVKENIHVAGSATTHGVPYFRDRVAEADAPPVRRLRAAGAIPIGRTNMPDLAIAGVHTVSQLFGDTVNPWDPGRTPGGTSGGDAVAVATGMAPLGLGNDSGGSVRNPAAFNGVAALKPSYGRFPADHRMGDQDPVLGHQLFPVDGPLARTVADLRAAYEALAGADPQDPRAVPVPLYGPRPDAPVRVGVVTDPGGRGDVHPQVRAAIEAAAAALQDAGHPIEEVEVPRLQDALDGYGALLRTEFALAWPKLRGLLTDDSARFIELFTQRHPAVGLEGYVSQAGVRLGVQRAWAALFERCPLLLGPVSTQPVPEPVVPRTVEEHDALMAPMRLLTASTYVGVPAVAVPTGVADGLPQGVQIMAGMYREDLCLDAAQRIEERLGVFAPIDPVGSVGSVGSVEAVDPVGPGPSGG
ncbi:indole acetimide hydrolase [Streptomyces sp. CB02959]|uniref:amidase n=1 Tax=Streptomyces sp. CB02959 TaxID=2020330 RepID=UPI000C28057F|nr:amidase [Streptomyces sp. CB02959]PJN36061.1 indole acetimide hydrolase [Streptomyces sp. CB02959]